MAITVETRTNIIELVVGMVGAAPGAAILSELADIVDGGLSLGDLAVALANNPAFKTLYPSFLTSEEFATNFLTALMGSEVDATTLSTSVTAMVADLNAGTHRGTAMYTAITTLSATAETDANFGAAAAALNNQTEVAIHYSVTTQQSADTLDELKAVVTSVTSSEATVTSAKATIDGTDAAGTEFTLTSGLNTINGTTNDDTILGTKAATGSTFSLGDIIDGKAGSDTLRLATDQTTLDTATATVSNVETLEISSAGTITSLDGDGDGYTSIVLDKTAAAGTNILGITPATALTISALNAAAVTTNIDYSSATGTADSATITVGAGGNAAAILDAPTIETLNLNFTGKVLFGGTNILTAAKTINVSAGGTSSLNLAGAAGTLGAVNVTGAGKLTLGTLNASYRTVDASASTSGVVVTTDAATTSVKGGSGTDTITVGAAPTTAISVEAGAGNDTVNVAALTLTAAGAIDGTVEKIDGGDGTDTLSTDEADLTVTNLKVNVSKATGFEALTATSAVTAFAASGFAINTFNFSADNTAAAGRTYTLASDDTLNLQAANGTNAMTLNPILDSGTNVVNLGLQLTTANVTQFGITASQVETINIASVDASTTAGVQTNIITTLTVQNNTKINISGNANTTITTATGTELTIDGSSSTGKLTVTVVGGNDTIVGGAKVDTLNGAAGIDTIDGAAGKDVITGGTGADNLTGGADTDIFVTPFGDSLDTAADSISDYSADTLRFAAGDNKAGAQAAAAVTGASVTISSGGKATFTSDDDTLAEKLVTVRADNTNIANNEVVFFEDSGNTYVYGAGTDTTSAAADFMVKLTGVTGLTTLTESTTTAGDFTVA